MKLDHEYLEAWRQALRDEFDWKLCYNQEVTKKCWKCGKLFHPMKGFETGSHYCSFDCSKSDHTERKTARGTSPAGVTHKTKDGKIRCRWCGKLFPFRKEYRLVKEIGYKRYRTVCFCSEHCKKQALLHNNEEIFDRFFNRLTEKQENKAKKGTGKKK